jgi:hypothetical protein
MLHRLELTDLRIYGLTKFIAHVQLSNESINSRIHIVPYEIIEVVLAGISLVLLMRFA